LQHFRVPETGQIGPNDLELPIPFEIGVGILRHFFFLPSQPFSFSGSGSPGTHGELPQVDSLGLDSTGTAHRNWGKPRSTLLALGSGQRLVTTFARV
jgi:hypothetical protein